MMIKSQRRKKKSKIVEELAITLSKNRTEKKDPNSGKLYAHSS